MANMYIRFQSKVPNLGTSSKLGIFQLAYRLRDHEDAPDYVYNLLNEDLIWLKTHLHSPSILDEDEHFRAICWFKPQAKKPLAKIWSMKAILEEFGYPIDILKTNDPGIIIYEDGWQVAAKPR